MGLTLLSLPYETVDAQKRLVKLSKKSLPQKNKRLTAIVTDAATGQVLYEENAYSPRCPASTIKILNIYIVFSELKRGKLHFTDQLNISQHAAQQKPSKLGLKAGSKISVRDAIIGTLTKSANDAAVVLGEAISGTEKKFANLMTRTAQKLGLTKTICINSSGWPDNAHGFVDPKQISTAADLAKLARALIIDFPQYYKFFSIQKFVYRGTTFVNWNSLLKKKKGVDGLKTGYGGGSVGFNLVASEKRGKRRIIVVVLGARTPQERNQKVSFLLDKGFEILEQKSKSSASTKHTSAFSRQKTPEILPSDDIFNLDDLQEIFDETTDPSSETILSTTFEENLSSFLQKESKTSPRVSERETTLASSEIETQKNSFEKKTPSEIPSDQTKDFSSFEADLSQVLERAEREISEETSSSSQKEKNTKLQQPKTKIQKKPLASKIPQKIPFGRTQDLPSFEATISEKYEDKKASESLKAKRPLQKGKNILLKNWVIQVATLSTSLKAKEEGKRLTQAFPALLKINRLRVLKTEKRGQKKNFCVRFLGFSKKEAQKACRALLSLKKQCVVIEPSKNP